MTKMNVLLVDAEHLDSQDDITTTQLATNPLMEEPVVVEYTCSSSSLKEFPPRSQRNFNFQNFKNISSSGTAQDN